jgi:hypothetical protein
MSAYGTQRRLAAVHKFGSDWSEADMAPTWRACPNDEAANWGGLFRRKVMEWFNQKTSIAGIQVSNWMIALAALIVLLLAYSFMR